MVTKDENIVGLIEALKVKRWSDTAIGQELGTTGVTIWRWRQGKASPDFPKLVGRALEELLARP